MILGGPRLRFLVLLQHVCLVMIVVGPVGFPPLSYEGLFIQKDRAKLVSRLILDLIELFELIKKVSGVCWLRLSVLSCIMFVIDLNFLHFY